MLTRLRILAATATIGLALLAASCGDDPAAACSQCGAGTSCDQASGKCVPVEQQGDPTCGGLCTDQQFCAASTFDCRDCPVGSYDCDKVTSNGCETGTPCGQSAGPPCDPTQAGACGSADQFCDSQSKTCVACPKDNFNCDGGSDTGCESYKTCEAPPVTTEPDSGCTKIDSWPIINPFASYNAMGSLTQAELRLTAGEPYVLLRFEDFHKLPGYPKTTHFGPKTDWKSCDVCVILAEGCTGYQGSAENYYNCSGSMYFAKEGTVTVQQADVKPSPAGVRAELSNLKLIEWDEFKNQPKPNARCWEVGKASIDLTW